MLKNRVIFALLFILSLNFIYSYGGPVPYTFFYIMVVFPLISFLYAYIVYKNLKCHQYISTLIASKGDTVAFEYVFNNTSFLMNPFVRSEFCDTTNLVGELGGKVWFSIDSLSFKKKLYTIKCKYRGIYDIGIDKVYIEDFLGIFHFNVTIDDRFKLKVYPRIININKFILFSNIMEESDLNTSLISEQMNDISEVKKYNVGDPLRKIHWKLTAKLNEIMVKNTESTSKNTTDFLFDLSPIELNGENILAGEDKMIEILCSLSYFLAGKRYPVRVHRFFNKINKLEFDNLDGFSKLYELATKIKFDSVIKPEVLLDLFLKNNTTGSNLFIFTHSVSSELAGKLIQASNIGWKVNLIYLILDGEKYQRNDEIMRNLRVNNVRVLEFTIDSDIKNIFESYKQVTY